MHSVEATICIRVTGGSWPDGFRGVFSTFTTSADDLKVKLLDFGDDGLPVDAGGTIKLSCSVVSVGLEEMLKVSAVACPMNKELACESSEASFKGVFGCRLASSFPNSTREAVSNTLAPRS